MRHWLELTEQEKRFVIHDMAEQGFGDHQIADTTQLSLEMIRQILSVPAR